MNQFQDTFLVLSPGKNEVLMSYVSIFVLEICFYKYVIIIIQHPYTDPSFKSSHKPHLFQLSHYVRVCVCVCVCVCENAK